MRIPWGPFFELAWFPEFFIPTAVGRKTLKLSFTLREGQQGTMNVALVDEFVSRFQQPEDMRWPINYYRQMGLTQLLPQRRTQLEAIYSMPISVPTTMVWGEKDGILYAKVAMKSRQDAGCEVDWRPLPGVGHFVDLEAPDKLAMAIRRVLAGNAK